MTEQLSKQEIRERTERIATKCYYRIIAENSRRLSETAGKQGLTTLQRLDLYQSYRDKAFSKVGSSMFFEDYYDLFDQIFEDVRAQKEWETLIDF